MSWSDKVTAVRWLYSLLSIAAQIVALIVAASGKTRSLGRTILYLILPVALAAFLSWCAGDSNVWIGIFVLTPFFLLGLERTKGPMWVLIFALPFIVVFGGLPLWEARNRNLIESGLPAPAKILAVRDLGIDMGPNPLIELRLQVLPSGEASYETDTKVFVSRLSMGSYRPGDMINVKYDPKKPKRVVVESIQSGALP